MTPSRRSLRVAIDPKSRAPLSPRALRYAVSVAFALAMIRCGGGPFTDIGAGPDASSSSEGTTDASMPRDSSSDAPSPPPADASMPEDAAGADDTGARDGSNGSDATSTDGSSASDASSGDGASHSDGAAGDAAAAPDGASDAAAGPDAASDASRCAIPCGATCCSTGESCCTGVTVGGTAMCAPAGTVCAGAPTN